MKPGEAADRGSDTVRYRFASTWPLVLDGATAWGRIAVSLRSGDPIPWWRSLRATGGLDGVRMTVRSVLGYRIRVVADQIVESEHRLDFRLSGDVSGRGSVVGDGPLVVWMEVRLVPRWMNLLEPAMSPAFRAAHRVVMWRGRRRFNRWLANGEKRGPRRR